MGVMAAIARCRWVLNECAALVDAVAFRVLGQRLGARTPTRYSSLVRFHFSGLGLAAARRGTSAIDALGRRALDFHGAGAARPTRAAAAADLDAAAQPRDRPPRSTLGSERLGLRSCHCFPHARLEPRVLSRTSASEPDRARRRRARGSRWMLLQLGQGLITALELRAHMDLHGLASLVEVVVRTLNSSWSA